MGFGSPGQERRPPGCADAVARVIFYVIIIAIAATFAWVMMTRSSRPDGHDPEFPTRNLIERLSVALDMYRTEYHDYPPDKATGLHPDLDRPGECLVYYLSGASIAYVPGASPPDYPWQHTVFQAPDREKATVFYTFKDSVLKDPDGDGIPEVVDWWGTPLMYNSGTETDGPFNQNGAPRHCTGKFDLFSAGPDREFGTEDDIQSWGNDPSLTGKEYDYDEINKAIVPAKNER